MTAVRPRVRTANESVLSAVLYFVGGIAHPWTLSLLWRWFVVPFGAPDIGFLPAYGLTLVATLLIGKNVFLAEEATNWWTKPAMSIIGPLVELGAGWVVHAVMIL